MSNLDLLPVASMVDPAPPAHSNRVRAQVASVDRDALDTEVIAAGGWIEERAMPASGGLRPGRMVKSADQPHVASWYVVPDSALSR